MPRARASAATTRVSTRAVGAPARPGLRWLLLALALAALPSCSLSSEGTGDGPDDSDSQPIDELDADVAGGLDAAIVRPRDGLVRDAGAPDGAIHIDARAPAVPVDAGSDAEALDAQVLADGSVPLLDAQVDAGNAGADASDAARSDANFDARDCDLGGTYAVRLDFDVSWEGTTWSGVIPVIAPGSGTLSMWSSLVVRAEQKKKGKVEVRACGSRIPDFEAGQNPYQGETYGVYVPESSWEAPDMPTWTVNWQSTCKGASCSFSADPLLAVLGARSTPPVAPSTEPGLELIDHDGDGKLALTTIARGPSERTASGKPYAYPPILAPWQRARQIMLAIGVSAQLEGAITSCDKFEGSVLAPAVEQGAVGCRGFVQGVAEEQECLPEFVAFIDENLPLWTVTAARFSMQRVSSVACSDVRAALP
jgi:hypothetical protein